MHPLVAEQAPLNSLICLIYTACSWLPKTGLLAVKSQLEHHFTVELTFSFDQLHPRLLLISRASLARNRALSGLEFTAHELWPVFDHPPKKLRDSLVVDVGHLLYRPFLWKALQTIRFEVDTVSQIYMRMKRR